MTRWIHPPELERPRDRARFDPVVEGHRYGLSRELSLAIWERVCADATDSADRRDEDQARQRFHELAARIAARGGRLRPEVGRVTRVGVEIDGDSLGGSADELKPRTPGRETLVAVEARRQMKSGEAAATRAGEATRRRGLPGAHDVMRAIAALQTPPRPDQATQHDASVGDRMSRLLQFGLKGIAEIPESSAVTGPTRPVTKDGEAHLMPAPDSLGSSKGAAPPPPEGRTPADHSLRPRLGFEDYRVLGLKAMLQRLRADHPLRQEVIAAASVADRSIAGRATLWRESLPNTTTPNGHALWRAAERHSATLYRRALSSGMVDQHDPVVESALQQCGAGQPLPKEIRREMERELGVSLAGVRVHTDAVAAHAARALGAEAFAIGEDIFFAEGKFAPDTRAGRKLLAHELTHVAQAVNGNSGPTGLRVSQPGEPSEQEADAVAERIDAVATPQEVGDLLEPPGTPFSPSERGFLHGSDPGLTAARIHDEDPTKGKSASVAAGEQGTWHGTLSSAAVDLPFIIQEALRAPGQPLDSATRSAMERSFGFNFGNVRVHADAHAAASARALHARAYTFGNDVVLGESGYRPDTITGRVLLAHELTHVVQQAGTGPGQPPSEDRSQAETEARAAAERVNTGERVAVSTRMPAHVAMDEEAPQTGGTVTIVISLASGQLEFRTLGGNHRYLLVQQGLRAGTYTAGVSVHGNRVHLSLSGDNAAASGQWSWRIRPGQEDPATLLRGVESAEVQIIEEALPEISNATVEHDAPNAPDDANTVVLTPEEAQRRCEAGTLQVMTFPLRFTRWNESYVIATREGDRIRVRMPMASYGNGRSLPGMHHMPPIDVVNGILLEPNQLVRIRFYSPRLNPFADDEVTESYRTGAQMLDVSALGDRAVGINMALTGVDALLMGPAGQAIGRGVSAVAGQVTRRVVVPGLAAAMIGTARVAEPALVGGASRAAVSVVEQRTAATAVEAIGARAITQMGVRATEQGAIGTGANALANVAIRHGTGTALAHGASSVTVGTLGRVVRDAVSRRGMQLLRGGGGGEPPPGGTSELSDIPHVRQTTQTSCGPACGQMASGYHAAASPGSTATTEAILMTQPEYSAAAGGMDSWGLSAALNRQAPVVGRTWQALDPLPSGPSGTLTANEIRAGLQTAVNDGNGVAIVRVIVNHGTPQEYSHWVMARSVQGNQVLIHDPEALAESLETVTAEGFGRFYWTGDTVAATISRP